MSDDNDWEVNFRKPDVLAEKMLDAAVPGFAVECDPEEAEAMGAFTEEALDGDEALTAALDLDMEDIADA